MAGKKYVPMDWQSSATDPATFQIPSRERKALKITAPMEDEMAKKPTTSDQSSNTHKLDKSQTGKKPTSSKIGRGDPETATPSGSPASASSNLLQDPPIIQQKMNETEHGRSIKISQVACDEQKLPMNPKLDATDNEDQQRWRPDIFVHAFVPRSLTAINESPAFLNETVDSRGIDFETYTSTFAAPRFLPAPIDPSPWRFTSNPLVNRLDHLSPEIYGRHFKDCLVLDLEAQVPELRSYDLFKAPLEVLIFGTTYRLKVPGLREGTPSVNLGDFILLRQLILDPVTQLPQGMDMWLAPGGGYSKGEPAPGFTKVQIRALVMAVDKASETLIIKANGILSPGAPGMFNVSFVAQPLSVESLHRAVEDVSQELSRQRAAAEFPEPSKPRARERMDDNWLCCMLFPVATTGVQQKTLPSAVFSQAWFDASLNYEQKKAVDSIQSQNYGLLPYLINGPPGTGKTKTICEVVMQLRSFPAFKGSILLCAPSNPAADILALRLRAHLDPKSMLRLNSFSRTFTEVPQELLPYCCVNDDRFGLPSFEKLMAHTIVVTRCQDADMLVQARVTNRDLIELQKNIFMAIHPDYTAHSTTTAFPLHWGALIVDEAAQATEPETLIPLTVVAPHAAYPCTQSPVFVMAGDQHQLNPRTYHKSTTLGISLFERLSNSPVYACHPLARKSLHRATQTSPMLRPPFVHLIRNYRSHPAILAIPSSLFYDNTLIPETSNTDARQSWTGWRGRRWPVLFACNGGLDECEDIRSLGGGWLNMRESLKAMAYARKLFAEGLITDLSEICIMSPFRAQVHLLRKFARKSGLRGLNIGPVDAFQGLESPFVIICTTRARMRFLEEDKIRGLGIVNEKKKFNVAITRAKQGLIVIGNPSVLATDPCWLAFMNFCRRNGLWVEDEEPKDRRMRGLEEADVNGWRRAQNLGHGDNDKTPPTGLEAALIFKERDKEAGSRAARRFMSGSESLEDAMWRMGLEAEQTLGLTEEEAGGLEEAEESFEY